MNETNLGALDLNLLSALDALLAERSVTRAARRTGVTQPAMSHSLARLRVLLADPLFVRSPRGMLPTPRARAIEAPLRRTLGELRALVRGGATFDPRLAKRTFTLGMADFGALVLLPPLAARLTREAPGVTILVRPVPGPGEVEAALENESFDLMVMPSVEPRANLVTRRLFRERFVCVVRAKHPALRKPFDLAAYAALPHLQIAPRGTPGGAVDDELAEHRLSRHVALRVADFLVAPLVIAGSDLVLTVPERVAQVFAATHALRVLEPPLELPGFTMSQVWHVRRKTDPAHAWLRGVLAEEAKE